MKIDGTQRGGGGGAGGRKGGGGRRSGMVREKVQTRSGESESQSTLTLPRGGGGGSPGAAEGEISPSWTSQNSTRRRLRRHWECSAGNYRDYPNPQPRVCSPTEHLHSTLWVKTISSQPTTPIHPSTTKQPNPEDHSRRYGQPSGPRSVEAPP